MSKTATSFNWAVAIGLGKRRAGLVKRNGGFGREGGSERARGMENKRMGGTTGS